MEIELELGVAHASHQIEDMRKAYFKNCWDVFEESFPGALRHPYMRGGKVGDSACLGYTQAKSYVRVVAKAGYGIYRMSIEWARIQPHEDVFCATALERYTDIAKAVRDSGMKLYLCLCHYTCPQWFIAKGGWLSEEAPALFTRYVEYVADALAPFVDTFLTFNETNVVSSGYIFAGMPAVGPHAAARLAYYTGRSTPPASEIMHRVNVHLLQSHAGAKEVIRGTVCKRVGLTISMQVMKGESAQQPLGRSIQDMVYGHFMRLAYADDGLGFGMDDDLIGIQSYTTLKLHDLVAAPLLAAGNAALRVANFIGVDTESLLSGMLERSADIYLKPIGYAKYKTTQMNYDYEPLSAAHAVEEVRRLVPVCMHDRVEVTEFGVATPDDEERVQYYTDAIAGLKKAHVKVAIAWSLVDNYEWNFGYPDVSRPYADGTQGTGPFFGLLKRPEEGVRAQSDQNSVKWDSMDAYFQALAKPSFTALPSLAARAPPSPLSPL